MTTDSKQRDEEGYLINPDDWTPDIASEYAREEGLELSDAHWLVIKVVRDYYSAHGIAPDVRHVTRDLSVYLDCDKKAAKRQLFALFPFGYVQQTCKIAGMRRPRAWSTG